ncbi:MAG: hypothetical protein LCH84_00555 [Gemmatimonadetes bacterium]|nr:hypothetical protein [Gemmatimonadota bacterium]
MPLRTLLLVTVLSGGVMSSVRTLLDVDADRRIVDTVVAGDAESEAAHGYAGHDDLAGVVQDTTFRRARGWMRYAMTAFDDTEVTLEGVFAGEAEARQVDLLVEDSLVARRTVAPASGPVTIAVRVPFAITRGRATIAVMVRGREGWTPALRLLRVVQDHHELAALRPAHGEASRFALHAGVAAPVHPLSGVVR